MSNQFSLCLSIGKDILETLVVRFLNPIRQYVLLQQNCIYTVNNGTALPWLSRSDIVEGIPIPQFRRCECFDNASCCCFFLCSEMMCFETQCTTEKKHSTNVSGHSGFLECGIISKSRQLERRRTTTTMQAATKAVGGAFDQSFFLPFMMIMLEMMRS